MKAGASRKPDETNRSGRGRSELECCRQAKDLDKKARNRGTNPPFSLESTNRVCAETPKCANRSAQFEHVHIRRTLAFPSARRERMQKLKIYERNHQVIENKGPHFWEPQEVYENTGVSC